MSINCDICLINFDKNNDNETDLLTILTKLKNCVPEVDWNVTVTLCDCCLDDLNKTYAFRELCIQSFLNKKHVKAEVELPTKQEQEEEVEEEPSTEFNDEPDRQSECSDDWQPENTKGPSKKKRDKDKTCEHCGKQFVLLKKHYAKCKKLDLKQEPPKQEDDTKPPKCLICNNVFKNRNTLKNHVRNVHAKEKNFKCELCERTFAMLGNLNVHKKSHSRVKTHICSFCGKGFFSANSLSLHEKIHANKRAYKCALCSKAFNTFSDLYKHKLCVHSDPSKWKNVCPFCSKRFALKVNLDTHIMSHTGEKNFACEMCEKRFISKTKLMKHMRTHTGERPFQCPNCDKTFIDKSYIKQHLKTSNCIVPQIV
ncbi:zinc finger protein 239 [Aethina tumida]|uniref:zinc finger protein 239 n=1 Tax=Aethina tumida TaxID=116153 RepID=UPI00096AE5C0|nr:zinc finger protein 239 [Aethina tumida]